MAAMPLVAQTTRGADQLRERRLFELDRKRIVARVPHSPTFEAFGPHLRCVRRADDE
jgi:hypothetical protein